jgi:hypothetical protein
MSAVVAFGSVAGTVATVAGAGTGDTVIIESTLNQNVEITLGGANSNVRTIAILGVSGFRPPLEAWVPNGATVGLRHLGVAPTSGSIAISVINSNL